MCKCHLSKLVSSKSIRNKANDQSKLSNEEDISTRDLSSSSEGPIVDLHDLFEEICIASERIELFSMILGLDDKWKSWQAIAEVCRDDPASIVRHLIHLKQFELARKLADLFQLNEARKEIEESFVYSLLLETNRNSEESASFSSFTATIQALDLLPSSLSISIAWSLLDRLESNHSKLQLIEFLLRQVEVPRITNDMDNGESTMESAQKMPQSEMKRLLMSEQISVLSSLFNEIEETS